MILYSGKRFTFLLQVTLFPTYECSDDAVNAFAHSNARRRPIVQIVSNSNHISPIFLLLAVPTAKRRTHLHMMP